MRVLITGGAGFIAYHLASALLRNNEDVILLDNFNNFYSPDIKRLNVRDLQLLGPAPMHVVDILDRANLRDVFDKTRPDFVVHLAAWAGVRPSLEKPELYSAVNVTGTVNLLELAKEFSIDVKNIIGIGDSENDICMVRECGTGIAFCSQTSYLNLVADIIITEKSFRKILEVAV